MKKLTHILFTLFCLCIPSLLTAAENDDSRYLAGAVPVVDGKVVFTKEFTIPGMSQEEIFGRVQNWMDAHLKVLNNTSRIVYSTPAKGQLVGIGDEWMVFSSTALSLDRTRIVYQLTALCQPEKCTLKVEKVRFIYREGKEKYTAEEWIIDKYALNKDKTKLVRGLAKWRRKTVDFIDNLAKELTEALSAVSTTSAAEAKHQQGAAKPTIDNGPIVITQKKQVKEVTTSTVSVAEQISPAAPAAKSIAPAELPTDLIQTGAGKLVIVIGEEPFNMTLMTANAGGSLGKVGGKPVIFTILSPEQPFEQLEKAETYTVRFYPNGQNEPSVVLQCRKLPSPATMEGMPRTYVGEILQAAVK